MGIGRGKGKRLMSGLLSLAMMLSVFSGMSFTVFADDEQEYPLYVGGEQVTYENMSSFGGEATDSFVFDDSGSVSKLTLKDATLTDTVKYTGTKNLNVILIGDNSIDVTDPESTDEVDGFVSTQADVTFMLDNNNPGSLSIKASGIGIYIEQSGGSITAIACDISVETDNDGVSAVVATHFTQRGGSLDLKGVNSALTCETGTLEANGVLNAVATGTASICCGINLTEESGTFTITSGSFTASGYGKAVNGKVKNKEAGMGWTSTNPTTIGKTINPSESGQTLAYKKVQFPSPYKSIESINVTVPVPQIGSSVAADGSVECTIEDADANYVISEAKYTTTANPVEGDMDIGYTIKFAPKDDTYIFPAGSSDVTLTVNGTTYTVGKNDFVSNLLTFSGTVRTAAKQDQTITGVESSYTIKVGDKIQIEPAAQGAISVTGNTGVVDYKKVEGTNKFEITGKAAGSAEITVKAAATPSYKEASKVITITVAKGDSSLTKAPAAKDLTYTGADQALVDKGEATNGTMQYALGSDNKTAPTSGWSTSIPSGKDAKTYYVWYKVAGGSNYSGVEPACVSVKIAKAKATLSKTPEAKSLTYNKADQALVSAGSATAGTLMYAAGKDSKTAPTSGWTTSVPTGKDAGTYYVWYKVEGNDNITGIAAKCITVKIAMGQAEVSKAPAAKTGLKENGTDLALVSAGTAKNGTLKYALGKDSKTAPKSDWTTSVPTASEAGTYYVWYKAEGDSNYSDSAAKCITVKIAEDTSKTSIKSASVGFEHKEYPYVGIPVHPNISVVLNGTQLKGKEEFTGELKDNDKVGTASLTITGVGKYKHSITKTFKIVTASVACSKTFESNVKDATDWSSSDKTIATVDSNGKITGKQAGSATITYKYKGETKTFTIQVLYKDVIKSSDFWYEPTYYLSGLGVVKGYDNQTKFKPDNDCTRAQMVTFLWRLNGSPKPKSTTTAFTDIKKSDYYYNAVLWAVEQGITTGTSKTKFGPAGVCTRAQTVTFLWRMAGKPAIGDAKNPFSDVKKGQYYYEAVIWASNQKIVAGYKDGTFKPSGKCARRQMVTFLYKYDKFVNGKG